MMNGVVKEIKFSQHGDGKGKLIELEVLSESIPFNVKRVYYIFDTKSGTVHGKHAHNVLKQLLVRVSGAYAIECEMLTCPCQRTL